MNHNEVTIGSYYFDDETIVSGSCYIGNSLVGDELSVDTLTVTVEHEGKELLALPFGTPVVYAHNGILVGSFVKDLARRVGANLYEIFCVSSIGVIDKSQHYGGIYTGESAGEVLEDIMGAVNYTAAERVKGISVYGWLPIATRRDNLRQLLFALGASVKKSEAGAIHIDFLNLKSPLEISDDRIASGGEVEQNTPVSGVIMLEHTFAALTDTEETVIFEGTGNAETITTPKGDIVTGFLIRFPSAHHSVQITGGTILELGVNYAVVYSVSYVTLTGKAYIHAKRETVVNVEGATGAEKLAKVTDATLVNLTNSETVAKRVADFYSKATNITFPMVMGAERPGDAIEMLDPFGEETVGLMAAQDINMGNLLVANATVVSGYTPDGGGDIFEHSVVLTENQEWTVPDGVTRIRAALISAGTGGNNGKKGANMLAPSARSWSGTETDWAANYQAASYQEGGKGGDAGVGGGAGKVLEFGLDVVPGQKLLAQIGIGGAGAVGGPVDVSDIGIDGSDTVFAGLSTADGAIYPSGYINILTGERYAYNGSVGVKGGRGSGLDPESQSVDKVSETDVLQGESIHGDNGETWGPGNFGFTLTARDAGVSNSFWLYAQGGGRSCGGGAAYGANGNVSASGGFTSASYSGSGPYTARVEAVGAPGGTGATPVKPPKAVTPGCGGRGGHGGGGAGSGGSAWVQFRRRRAWSGTVNGPNPFNASAYTSLGGSGGEGGDGADGCVIIYY